MKILPLWHKCYYNTDLTFNKIYIHGENLGFIKALHSAARINW